MWIWIWLLKTDSVTDFSIQRGKELQTTVYYKTYKGDTYVVKEVYKVRDAKGKHNKKLRGQNK